MFGLGGAEIGLIFLIVLLIFGPSQIPKMAPTVFAAQRLTMVPFRPNAAVSGKPSVSRVGPSIDHSTGIARTPMLAAARHARPGVPRQPCRQVAHHDRRVMYPANRH